MNLVRKRVWLGVIKFGVPLLPIEKIARVVKIPNLEIYAIKRGESFEDFLRTGRVPNAR